ncbi:MAG: methyltransferase domain-containing protein [Ruminococcaceae bacterium]|nr:methyltransferase domain-containing protein [Oscillospiraceae bacterium]
MSDLILTEINENLKIFQKKEGLTFTSDAYLLYAYMKRRPKAIAADFGSGTGVISLLSAAKRKYAQIHACEIQSEFYDIISKNIIENRLEEYIKVHNTDITKIGYEYFGKQIDVVFSNPPYMKSDSGKTNASLYKNVARHEICGTIYDFCNSAQRVLKHGGYFYCVYRPDRLTDLIDAMRNANLEPKKLTFVHAKASLGPCLALTEAKKGASSSLIITKPLIMYNDDLSYTDDLKYIYENGEFNEQYQKSR